MQNTSKEMNKQEEVKYKLHIVNLGYALAYEIVDSETGEEVGKYTHANESSALIELRELNYQLKTL